MTRAHVDVNRLTPSEAERFWSGDWTSPRCATCGCLADNHAAGSDGEPSGCKVCLCLVFASRRFREEARTL